jgi:hypothetical protein
MTRSIRLSLSLVLLVVACSENPDSRNDTASIAERPGIHETARVDTNRVTGSKPPPVIPIPSSTPSRAAVAAWTVSESGLGALRAGMTIAEAAKAVGGSFSARPGEAKTCGYAVWREAPPNVLVMLDEGRVARVDIVRDSRIPTSKGARIGDTEARIKELYKGRVVVTPHEYTDGHYLTVTPEPGSSEDRNYRLVFETDGNRVLRYRGGKLPQVGYVEGCS